MKSPLISIIIPIFNSEPYLRRCIESIYNQDFIDFEIIAIDDGSLDNSYKLLRELSDLDRRLILLHQENKGVSQTRNTGIKLSHGEYIIFVDSDDYLLPHALSNYVRLLKFDADLFIQGFKIINYNNCEVCSFDFIISEDVPSLLFLINNKDGCSDGFLWHKMFKKSIINQYNILFDEKISFSEDAIFWYEYTGHINKYCISSDLSYAHVESINTSLTKRQRDINELVIIYSALQKVVFEMTEENQKVLRSYLFKRFIDLLILPYHKYSFEYYFKTFDYKMYMIYRNFVICFPPGSANSYFDKKIYIMYKMNSYVLVKATQLFYLSFISMDILYCRIIGKLKSMMNILGGK